MATAKRTAPLRVEKKIVKKTAAKTGTVAKKTAAKKETGDSSSDVEEYLAAVPADARAALTKLRQVIRSAAAEASEVISYGIPTFKLHGRPLVGFAAFPHHCGFYLMSVQVMRAHAAELEGYELGKGSIRFAADQPLPAALVKKLVKARIAENQTAGRR